MENRDAILRKLAALKEMAARSEGNEAEAAIAMRKYNELMLRYNLTETDLHIRQEGIGESIFTYKEGKQKHEIYWALSAIGKLSNTRPITHNATGEVTFFGTHADRDYAEFLYRLCYKAIETEWKAYRYSFDYTKLHRAGLHGRKIRHSFRTAFVMKLARRMIDLAKENMMLGDGSSLVVVKTTLINAYVEQECGKIRKNNTKITPLSVRSAAESGVNSADKVRLRQEMSEETKQLEYGG